MVTKVKYIAYVVSSIDGKISKDSQSGVDWASKEDWSFFQKSLEKIDAVIVGHNTYKVAKIRLQKRNTIVLTSKISKSKSVGSVTFINPKKLDIKLFLQSKNYKNIAILGGSEIYNFCLKNKMLDELFITIEPYVFTTGILMFSGDKFKKYRFILESAKKLNKKGTILLKYKRR